MLQGVFLQHYATRCLLATRVIHNILRPPRPVFESMLLVGKSYWVSEMLVRTIIATEQE